MESESAASRILMTLAAENDSLRAEVERLRQPVKTSPEPVVKARKKRMQLSTRVAMSKSWTPARRAAASLRMSDYWQLEKATRPERPNGQMNLI